jgi:hypothetical protein
VLAVCGLIERPEAGELGLVQVMLQNISYRLSIRGKTIAGSDIVEKVE